MAIYPLSVSVDLPILDMSYLWNHISVTDFLSLSIMGSRFIYVVGLSVFHSFLWLHTIPLHTHITFSLSMC